MLNSILVEGVILAEAKIRATDDGKEEASFTIVNSIFHKNKEGLVEKKTHIEAEAYGRLVKSLKDNIAGKTVRIVGKLEESDCSGRLVLIPEHIEFKKITSDTITVTVEEEDNDA